MVHVASKLFSNLDLQDGAKGQNEVQTHRKQQSDKGVMTLLDLHSQKLNKNITIEIWRAKRLYWPDGNCVQ